MIGALMSRLGPRQRDPVRAVPINVAKVRSACLLANFVDALRKQPEPVVVELGPATEGNVAFLGEHVACRIFVEDLLEKLSPAQGETDHDLALPPLEHADESIDGILCWDIFDYLNPGAAEGLADDLARILRPGGALLLYHRTESMSDPRRVKYEIVDESRLRWRIFNDAVPRPSRVLQSREVAKMFRSLNIAGAIRLKSQMREVLFRKSSVAARAG